GGLIHEYFSAGSKHPQQPQLEGAQPVRDGKLHQQGRDVASIEISLARNRWYANPVQYSAIGARKLLLSSGSKPASTELVSTASPLVVTSTFPMPMAAATKNNCRKFSFFRSSRPRIRVKGMTDSSPMPRPIMDGEI